MALGQASAQDAAQGARLSEELRRFDEQPGGSPAGASLHQARAVCRRAERAAVALSQTDRLPEGIIVFLNRLSDHLFTAARWANKQSKRSETPWEGLAGK